MDSNNAALPTSPPAVAPPFATPELQKEYIYAGSRLVATEERANTPPAVSITSPTNNSVFTTPVNITISATASDTDGTINKVEFFQGATLLNTDTVAPYSFTWNNVAVGSYSLTAKATDNNNAVTTSTPAINIVVNPGCTPASGLIISEFRLRGPNGSNDEYIELFNNSDQNIVVCTADGSSGWAVVSSEGVTRFIVASGTVIPARAHYLAVAGGYSLTGYSGSTPGDLTYGSDIPDNSGLALFNTSSTPSFTLANRFDAVGFTSSSTLYREGAGLALLGGTGGQFAFARKLTSGYPADAGDNPTDFIFVATDAGVYGSLVAVLGAPAPENLASPLQRNATLAVTMLDPAVAPGVAPNRVRDTSAVGPNAALGTLSLRRTITNNTGFNVTKLRFRICDVTTLNSPGYTPGGAQADMRVLNSSDFTVTITGGQQVLVRGTTVDTPPAQSMGGGMHSSLQVGVITLAQPLAPGQSIRVQWLLGVQQSGSFRFFVNVEALIQ
ncbi:MAG TPA: Ig-like domain-containing protein [Pyrinomonadaceae bacterium]|nr:Ig-like domain-containing protein [Pyrinomonadaceae bacterium]